MGRGWLGGNDGDSCPTFSPISIHSSESFFELVMGVGGITKTNDCLLDLGFKHFAPVTSVPGLLEVMKTCKCYSPLRLGSCLDGRGAITLDAT